MVAIFFSPTVIFILQVKAKEITGEDLDITVQDINTDVKVELNLNALALTEGIVSIICLICFCLQKKHIHNHPIKACFRLDLDINFFNSNLYKWKCNLNTQISYP